ncbi:hypothetical protein K474DRAFT_1653782 [Panus rudis PR-1116 ss-1]|nr:hypothetical protein K474DRAFT_1653782 [Panus rudis PR-1116 ss-1]
MSQASETVVDGPPTKRPRLDADNGKLPTRRQILWYGDGNVVLVVGDTSFRLRRSILSRNSDVFNDMLQLAQPQVDGGAKQMLCDAGTDVSPISDDMIRNKRQLGCIIRVIYSTA